MFVCGKLGEKEIYWICNYRAKGNFGVWPHQEELLQYQLRNVEEEGAENYYYYYYYFAFKCLKNVITFVALTYKIILYQGKYNIIEEFTVDTR